MASGELCCAPVTISANTVYVASYHTNTGHYSFNSNYFSTNRDNSPLHAPASGGSWGGNGVYGYGANSVFPSQTFNANNYWVDVVLQAGPVDPAPVSITTSSLAERGAEHSLLGYSRGKWWSAPLQLDDCQWVIANRSELEREWSDQRNPNSGRFVQLHGAFTRFQ